VLTSYIVPHIHGNDIWVKWQRHKESMKIKEGTINVWINFLNDFGEEWKKYLPEKIRESYQANIGKEVDEMDLKAFDTKWFIGCLRSINPDVYKKTVAAILLVRSQNQNKDVTRIQP